jgi:hypothetical protein
MEINTKYIQIRGKIETDQEFEIGDDIPVIVCITAQEIQDQDDGTFNIIYKAKLFNEEDR